ncbi:MAG TPA: hypothetical protein PLD46_06715 [Hyphomicrobium sp.]|nr:hypothetical protein [Hyphomicrobium sp.]
MLPRSSALIIFALCPMLSGCASSNLGDTSAVALSPGSVPQNASIQSGGVSGTASKAGYVLSADEQALECKQLTGRMQIRILELRDYNERNRTTLVSRALQTGSTAVFGGPKAGLDPDGTYARDRAALEAYNHQLEAKGCKTYDLESQLQPQDVRVTPSASIKPASGPVH